MDELLYETLNKYFRTLSVVGFKKDPVVFKMLVLQYIQEITTNEFRYFITNKDIKLMQDLLYQLFGSTCEISFPTNNRCCCMHICGDVPEYDSPQIENFRVAIPDDALGETTIKAATFDLINKRNVKADTLKIVYLNEGITVAEGLPIESPATILNHTINIKEGVTYSWKASVIDTRGDEIKSKVFTYESGKKPSTEPTITGFTLVPNKTNYTGTQNVTFTGATFTLSKGDNFKENSLEIIWGTNEVMGTGLSTSGNSISFASAITKNLVEGNTYTARASVEDINGKKYYSNTFSIKVSAPVASVWMYTGNTDVKPTNAEILAATKYDYKSSKQFQTPVMTLKNIWFCLPANVTLISAENVNQAGDFMYGGPQNVDRMTHEDVTINGEAYKLHYMQSVIATRNPYKVTVQ